MGLTRKNIKKWWNMIRGKSIFHVNQGVGKCYSFNKVAGYYNDLTEKVIKDKEHYDLLEVIKYDKSKHYFPIAVFQYGLACYDLYLLNVEDKDLMLKKFLVHLEWAFENQNNNGSWDNFIDDYPENPYSSMAQGEGASLLIRGYLYTKDKKYLEASKKALDFMLVSIDEGGTSKETNDHLFLFEFTFLPYVYNGWLFSIFGLMDYVTLTNDSFYKEKMNKTIKTFLDFIDDMDNGYWSMYRNDKTIASPFYHYLHIAQLRVMYEYTKEEKFHYYADLFEKYQSKKRNKHKAFLKKTFQKVFSKNRS